MSQWIGYSRQKNWIAFCVTLRGGHHVLHVGDYYPTSFCQTVKSVLMNGPFRRSLPTDKGWILNLSNRKGGQTERRGGHETIFARESGMCQHVTR